MNIFKRATKACRSASRSHPDVSRAVTRIKPVIISVLERALETAARTLCVESHGVMTLGHSGASVVRLTDPLKRL